MENNKIRLFFRAMRLYKKAAANPYTIGFEMLLAAAMLVFYTGVPKPVGSNGYMTMLGVIPLGKIGIFWIIMLGNLKLQQNKFYASCSCGKMLYTVVPIVTSFVLSLLYDAVFTAAAAVNAGSAGIADAVVLNAISDAFIFIVSVCYGKQKRIWWLVLPYILIIFLPRYFSRFGMIDKGLELIVSMVIAIVVYVASIALSLLLVNIWWKKSDRSARPNRILMNAVGG